MQGKHHRLLSSYARSNYVHTNIACTARKLMISWSLALCVIGTPQQDLFAEGLARSLSTPYVVCPHLCARYDGRGLHQSHHEIGRTIDYIVGGLPRTRLCCLQSITSRVVMQSPIRTDRHLSDGIARLVIVLDDCYRPCDI